ncbi:MAG: hypothetical protein WDN28_03940 [Chthoniobacter sp.]
MGKTVTRRPALRKSLFQPSAKRLPSFPSRENPNNAHPQEDFRINRNNSFHGIPKAANRAIAAAAKRYGQFLGRKPVVTD